jgi:uncharacterized membrane protein
MVRDRLPAWTDEQFDVALAYVLRTGVLLSAAVVACGGVVFLIRHGFEQPAFHLFRGEPATLRSIRGIAGAAMHFQGRALIQLGLLFLIATPIARVVFSVLGFLRQRDRLYVGITLAVLTLLTYSLLGG